MAVNSRRGMHGIAVDGIGRRIVNGELVPGQIIDVDAFEHDYDASRTVIREALRVLAAKGMVGARPKRGTFVLPREQWSLLDPDLLRWQFEEQRDPQFLANLAEVRQIAELAAARLAAQRRTDDDLNVMRDALAALDLLSGPPDVTDNDLRFHRTLLRATGNELLQRLALVIEAGVWARDPNARDGAQWAASVAAHRAVFEAVEARDPVGAEAEMRRLLALAVGNDTLTGT